MKGAETSETEVAATSSSQQKWDKGRSELSLVKMRNRLVWMKRNFGLEILSL